MVFRLVETPIGVLTLIGSERGVEELLWESQDRVLKNYKSDSGLFLCEAQKQLQEYFEGKRKIFQLKLSPSGTSFQKSVWKQLSQLKFGETVSYGELAKRMGDPNKARAIGSAVGKNPVPIFIPCHRVIGAKGEIGGFSGGVEKKLFLLSVESRGG